MMIQELIAVVAVAWVVIPILLKAEQNLNWIETTEYLLSFTERLTVFRPARCNSKKRLDGKTVLITGANTGLGKVTASDLASRGAKVYMACRDLQKAELARQDILKSVPSAQLKIIKLNLASLRSVRECAEQFIKEESKLDILVANAGFGSFACQLTEDGVERHLAVNHLGHFYLTRLLLPCLQLAGTELSKSRVIVVSSLAHRIFVSGVEYNRSQIGVVSGNAYGESKLANLLFVKHLDKLLNGNKNVTVNGLHPGTVMTEFFRNYLPYPTLNTVLNIMFASVRYMLLTEEEGAQTQIWASVAEELEGVSGKYLRRCSISMPGKAAQDEKEAERLWKWSCDKTGLPIPLETY